MGTDGNEGVAKLRVLIFGNCLVLNFLVLNFLVLDFLVLNFLLVCLLPCLQPIASLQ